MKPFIAALALTLAAPAATAEVFFTGSTVFGVGYGLQQGPNGPRTQPIAGGDYYAGITRQFDNGWRLTLVVGFGVGHATGHEPPAFPPAAPARPRR